MEVALKKHNKDALHKAFWVIRKSKEGKLWEEEMRYQIHLLRLLLYAASAGQRLN